MTFPMIAYGYVQCSFCGYVVDKGWLEEATDKGGINFYCPRCKEFYHYMPPDTAKSRETLSAPTFEQLRSLMVETHK